MSGPAQIPETPVDTVEDLVAFLAAGAKPKSRWRIGTEHEKFPFRISDLGPLPYDDAQGAGRASVRALLEGLQRFGWQGVYEDGKLIALTQNGEAVTLEPGGQVELSGAPLETVHQTCDEVHTHLAQVQAVGGELGFGMLGLGFQPKWPLAAIPQMPKGRYAIMRAYMPKRGKLGLDMMFRTCTVQVNLDFEGEADMVKKLRVGLNLQPVITALYANSPFVEGKPSGFLSYRSFAWAETDPDRTGMLPFAFEDGMGFERYAAYALDVPMYFVYRQGRYIDVSGHSFRDFLAGKLAPLPGEKPSLRDWADHLTTLFPEVRLKSFLEMRGADGGPWARLCALPAFWVGLLYETSALDAAWDLCKGWDNALRERLRAEVPKLGLNAKIGNRKLAEIARELLEIASLGLIRRRRLSGSGKDESYFLEPLKLIADSGVTPAEDLLARYHGPWTGSVDPVFKEFAY
jgi:glutamate--cysteine ligase